MAKSPSLLYQDRMVALPSWEHVVLSALSTRGAGPALVSRLLAAAPSPSTLLTPDAPLPAPLGELLPAQDPAVIDQIQAGHPAAQELAVALHDQRVVMLLRGGPAYSAALLRTLGPKAPPVLFVQGNQDLLQDAVPAVGFCGSRHASPRGLTVASACAERLAAQGVNVVSGHAAGVDEAVHAAALRAGTTTLVIPEGILRFRLRSSLAARARADNLVVVSSFPPRLPWSAGNAMARNHILCGLSGALIVVEAGETGGTLAAGNAALEHAVPLFVVDFAPPVPTAAGNTQLLARGGRPLRRRPSGEPNLDAVLLAARRLALPKDPAAR